MQTALAGEMIGTTVPSCYQSTMKRTLGCSKRTRSSSRALKTNTSALWRAGMREKGITEVALKSAKWVK